MWGQPFWAAAALRGGLAPTDSLRLKVLLFCRGIEGNQHNTGLTACATLRGGVSAGYQPAPQDTPGSQFSARPQNGVPHKLLVIRMLVRHVVVPKLNINYARLSIRTDPSHRTVAGRI